MRAAVAASWGTPAFELPPTAAGTGPFPGRAFLETWWDHRAAPDDELLVVASDDALLPLVRSGTVVRFAGEADLTDYHSPRGGDLTTVVGGLVDAAEPGWTFDLDSLPEPAAGMLAEAFGRAGIGATVTLHEVAATVPLPATYDDYLQAIGKKQRHELRRKRRRFTEEVGEPKLARHPGDDAVASFAAMHRLSDGVKGRFMTPPMEAFFVELHRRVDAVVDILSGADDAPVAAAFGFEDDEGYYLYNSAYDPAASAASPGVVLVDLLLEHAIAAGKPVFDFLKGDEEYKFRLGAAERPLYRVSGSFGAGP